MPDDSDRRTPGAALRRAIELDRPHCIGVGCNRSARTCDIDHRRDWALGGRTKDPNLDPACGRHHTVKTKGGWTLHRWERHSYRWCSPLGREYTTTIPRIIWPAPAPAAPDMWWDEPEPDLDGDVDADGIPWQESQMWKPPKPTPPPSPPVTVPAAPSRYDDPPPF